jgi:UDP-GlcNAc3NAcA epimerase
MRAFAPMALERSRVLERLGIAPGDYYVATVHRAENTEGERLAQLTGAIARVAREGRPVVFPLHPRTAKAVGGGFLAGHAGLKPIDPLGYLDMIRLVAGARVVLTDSGGLQKEAFFLGRPCVTLRDETEWVETVKAGGNKIAGTDPERILASVSDWERMLATGPPDFTSALAGAFGDGRASARILDESLAWLASRAPA